MSGSHHDVAAFVAVLKGSGLHAALKFLNSRVRHRFTGVYRFAPPLLRNVCLYDRENPALRSMSSLQLKDTYCSIVAINGEPFQTDNATADSRLLLHPARFTALAYYGTPLTDSVGRCVGSLCHWDTRPRVLPPIEREFLLLVAPFVAREALSARHHAPSRGDRITPASDLFPSREDLHAQ